MRGTSLTAIGFALLLSTACTDFEVALKAAGSKSTHSNLFSSAQNGDVTIQGIAAGHVLSVQTSAQMAGAVFQVNWNGVDFIDNYDHGRQMQSAVTFDGYGECQNPTEAGSMRDTLTSTSQLLSMEVSSNGLRSRTRMAYWLPRLDAAGRPWVNSSPDPFSCGQNHPARTSVDLADSATGEYSDLSRDVMTKEMTIGFAGLDNVIEYNVTFHVHEDHQNGATYEAVTAYLQSSFSVAYALDPATGTMNPLTVAQRSGTQTPGIYANPSGSHAMGLYSPDMRTDGSSGYTYLPNGGFYKASILFNAFDAASAAAGDHNFRTYVIIGTVEQVKTSMLALHRVFNPGAPAPRLGEGFFQVAGNAAISYSNGSGAFCSYSTFDDFIYAGGRSDASNVVRVAAISSSLRYEGTCASSSIPEGFFMIAGGIGIQFSNGAGAYCGFQTFDAFLAHGGAADLSNVRRLAAGFPSGLRNDGVCQ